MNGENRLPRWARKTLIGGGLFLAGALLAFGYSYRPLHGALSWKVGQLESRLDDRNRENVQLSDLLARLRASESRRIDPETLAQVERELDQTKRVLTQAEKDLERAQRKRREASTSSARWRKLFEELRDTSAAASTPDPTRPSPDDPTSSPGVSSPSAESPATPGRAILSPNETTAPIS